MFHACPCPTPLRLPWVHSSGLLCQKGPSRSRLRDGWMDVVDGPMDGQTGMDGWMDAQLMGQMDGQCMDYGRMVSG